MMTNDGFQPDRPPTFLSESTEETGHADIGKALDIAGIASRILKACMLAVTVTAIGIAVLSIENPVALVANVTDWWVDKPALQPEADPSTPAIQSADTQDLTTTTTDAPTRGETVAAVEPAEQRQESAEQRQEPAEQSGADTGQPVTEALFKQFQAWAAEEEARAQAAPAQPAPVRVAQEAPAQVRSVKKQRRVRSVHNARAEIRPQRNHRAKLREEQDARQVAPPAADPRLQDPSVQNVQTPSLLQSLGLSN